jgi:signal transduction histidine kinase
LSGEKNGFFDALSGIDQKRRIGYFITSELVPYYIYSGYDYSYLEREMLNFTVLVGSSWFLFSVIVIGIVLFAERMEKVRQKSRVSATEIVSAERKRLLLDMHDSIGASLAVLITHLNSPAVVLNEVKRRATEILIELRLLVDSVDEHRTDMNTLLASVRYRMQSGLEQAGINVIWKVDQLSKSSTLTPHDAFALKLIMMEALSNVIQHSHADAITLSATHDKAVRTLTITIADNGCGFDAETAIGGAGVKNMRTRARSLSWKTAIRVDSKLGQGTVIQIKMELPADIEITD